MGPRLANDKVTKAGWKERKKGSADHDLGAGNPRTPSIPELLFRGTSPPPGLQRSPSNTNTLFKLLSYIKIFRALKCRCLGPTPVPILFLKKYLVLKYAEC